MRGKKREINLNNNKKERIDVCLEHARNLIALKGEKIAIKEMRSLACFYIKGMPNASLYKVKINELETYNDLENLLRDYLKEVEGQE